MTKKQYIGGLIIQPNYDMKHVIKELSKAFANIKFKYKVCNEFPSYIAEYSGARIELFGMPYVVNKNVEITSGITFSGEKVEEYSVSFQADENYIINNIPELHKSFPVSLKEAAVGGCEITPYLLNFIKKKCKLHIGPDPWPEKIPEKIPEKKPEKKPENLHKQCPTKASFKH